jgi:hypothetical protein
MPITSIVGKLPLVRARDTGTVTIPHKYSLLYRAGTSSGAHSYDHSLVRADTSPATAVDGDAMYFVNSWAVGWSRDL